MRPWIETRTERRAAHQPVWADPAAVPGVIAELSSRHALVEPAGCHALLRELGEVAERRAFVLQGGDCAEPFADATERIRAKAHQLEELADLFEAATGTSVVRIGRFAGQYAKPRSVLTETLPDGRVLPVFLGEAVNGPELDDQARRPDVRRLLAAYDHAADALDSLLLNRFLPLVNDAGRDAYAPTWVSHEALLLDFERALMRPDPRGGRYASSAHMVWIGERTRSLDGAHVLFAESITNPVGVKIGPAATPGETAELIDRLGGAPGRLTLIVRMGPAIAERLPALLDGLGERASRVVWLTDPMHGNTLRTAAGQKTRVLTDVLTEVRAFFAILSAQGLRPGGLHLELTPRPVTECVDNAQAVHDPQPLRHYESTCDPRLNPAQAELVVRTAAQLFTRVTWGRAT